MTDGWKYTLTLKGKGENFDNSVTTLPLPVIAPASTVHYGWRRVKKQALPSASASLEFRVPALLWQALCLDLCGPGIVLCTQNLQQCLPVLPAFPCLNSSPQRGLQGASQNPEHWTRARKCPICGSCYHYHRRLYTFHRRNWLCWTVRHVWLNPNILKIGASSLWPLKLSGWQMSPAHWVTLRSHLHFLGLRDVPRALSGLKSLEILEETYSGTWLS